MFRYAMILSVILLFSGCAKTTVVLLPDDDGTVGRINVANLSGESREVGEAGYSVVVSSDTGAPSVPAPADSELMEKDYADIKDIQPPKPISFTLYFQLDSNRLTAESEKQIPNILKEIRLREPCEVSLIGHSDTLGNEDYNIKLSMSRAEEVGEILKREGVVFDKLHITSHGENDPVVKTPDNFSEPRNRRVEVLVR